MAGTYQLLEVTVELPKAELEAKAEIIDEAVKAGLERVAGAAQQIAERKVGEIYARPIPSKSQVNAYNRKGGGRRPARVGGSGPAWERSGDLAKAVEAAPQFENENEVRLTADLPYASTRHDLGVTYQPKEPALGIVRRDPFFGETVEAIAPAVPELFADGFSDVFDKS